MANEAVFMPVLPSYDGFFKSLSSNAKKGGDTAGKDFAGAMEKSLKQAEKRVESLGKAQERANNRAADATDKTRIAQLKLSEAMNDSSTSASKLADLTAKYEKAQREEAQAAKAAERAASDLAKAQNEVQKATDQADDAIESHAGNLDGFSSSIKGAIGQIGMFTAGLAGVAGVAGFAGLGKDLVAETNLINMQLGHTGAAAENTSAQIRTALTSGVAGSAEEAANAIGAIESQWKYLGSEGEQTAGDLADNFMAFSRVMGVDVAEATQTAGQLVLNGLAPDIETAADLMTAAMQRVPAQMRDELPEIINEYGVHFAGLGLSGEEAFSMLVSASERGKWALDKTGDALKEFQLRGSDMSKTSVEAYEMIGLSAEDMSNAIAAGGDGAREALQATAQGLLDIESPADRANAAIALFGTPIEDLSVDQIPMFLESLTGMENSMAGAEGASQALADQIANSLDGRIDRLKGQVQSLAGDAFMWLWDVVENQIIPGFQSLGDWIQRNEAWIGPLVATIGGAAAAWGAWTLAVKGWQAATKVATAVQGAFNMVMNANPVLRIVTVIAALVAGLIYFFTQTEIGQELWAKFTAALGAGWDWVTDKLSAGWEWIQTNVFTPLMNFVTGTLQPIWESVMGGISAAWDGLVTGIQWAWETIYKPVLNGIWQLIQVTLGVIGAVVLTPLLLAWNLLSTGIQWAWENVIQPVWSAISKFATDTLWPILQSAFQWIGEKWQQLSNLLGVVWSWLQSNVFTPLTTFVMGTLWPIMQTAFQQIMDKWTALYNAFMAVWGWLQSNVFTPLSDYVTGTLWPTLQNAFQWIIDKWDALGQGFNLVKNFVVDTVFAGFQAGLSALKDFVGSIVDGIGTVWNGLRSLLAKPINFMINTVYNDGILRAWNIIAGILPGLEPGSPLAGIPEHATGGRIKGPGTGTSDDVLMWGSNGEHMLTAREVQDLGGHSAVYAMRNAVDSGKPFTYDGKGGLAILPKTDERAGDLAGAAPGLLIPGFKDGGEIRPMWEIQLENGHRAASMRNGNPYTWGFEDCSGYMSAIADAIINGGDGKWSWATGSFPGGQPWAPGLGQGFSVGVHDNPGGPGGGHTAGTLTGVGPYATVNVESGGGHGYVAYGGPAAGADSPQFQGVNPGQFHLAIGADGAFESGGGGGFDPGAMRSWISEKLGGVVDTIMDPIVSLLPKKPPEWQGIPRGVYDSGRDGLVESIADGVAGLADGLATVWNAVRNIPDLVADALNGADDVNDAAGEGYHKGGLAGRGRGLMQKTAIEPEMVLNPAMTQAFIRWMDASPESLNVMGKEISEAFFGRDWGYGELAYTFGSEEVAHAIVSSAAALGEFTRAATPILEDAGKNSARNVLDLFGMGEVVDIAEGVATKLQEIGASEEVQEAVKTVMLDPDLHYMGSEIEKKLTEIGIDVERIKTELGSSTVGGLSIMA